MKKLFMLGLAVAATQLCACSEPAIVGKVVDERGLPLEGVAVRIDKSDFATTTSPDGAYKLDYAAGSFALVFEKDGFLRDTLALTLAEKQQFRAQPVVLYSIPEESGIFLVAGDGYRILARSRVRERVVETGSFIQKRYHRVFTVDGRPTRIEMPECTFLDFDPGNQVLFRLNERNEVGRLVTVLMGLVESTQFDMPKEQLRQLDREVWKRQISLTPGHYAFVRMVRDNFGNTVPGRECYYFVVADSSESGT